MTAGNIGTWQKKAGDGLQPGDVLVEIETDKAQMDFEFQDEGVLAKVLKDAGEKDVAVGSVRIFPNFPADLRKSAGRFLRLSALNFNAILTFGCSLAHCRPG